MSDTVIRVENISKQYWLRQQQHRRYVALRDVITAKAKAAGRRLFHPQKNRTGSSHREEFWALKDVSFEVKQGEVIGVIGRNGAGKSTLLKILSRITEPTTGRITLKGRVASLLEVGTGFHPELTGRENIYLNGAILGMTRLEISRKFDEIVAFAEVDRFLDTPVKHYSSGMYVRLAFAVAAHLEPEILLVDEVLAVGDVGFQKKCLGKMGDVATKEGRTVFLVSHNMPSIQALCKRTFLLKSGSLETEGLPQVVISKYLALDAEPSSSEVDLTFHEGRSHSKEPALKKAWFTPKETIASNVFLMGSTLEVHTEFQCSNPVTNPGFGMAVEDGYGRRIFAINNYMTSTESNKLKTVRSGVFSFKVPNLCLLPGKYFISLSLVEDHSTWFDFVEQAISFEVHPFDVYGSGKIPTSSQGIVFVDAEVTIQSDNQA